jgi:hypothetical protein
MSHWGNSGIPAAPAPTAGPPAGTGAGAPQDPSSAGAVLLPRLYDRTGRTIDLVTYVQLHQDDPDYERVAAEAVGPYWVSTLWFGIGTGPARGGQVPGSRRAPTVFRTLIVRSDRTAPDPAALGLTPDTLRYATEADARAGHAHAVTQLREASYDATAERPAITAPLA